MCRRTADVKFCVFFEVGAIVLGSSEGASAAIFFVAFRDGFVPIVVNISSHLKTDKARSSPSARATLS